MNFEPTGIPNLFLILSEPNEDLRGSFWRIHCRQEFAARGLSADFEQSSLSYNAKKGTVRGLHFQVPPHAEAKLVCCVAGNAFDVVVDLRRSSPTFGRARWFTLAGDRPTMVYVPEGCAHGFQTLADDTTLFYMISTPFEAAAARGIRWNDPALGIPWPEQHNIIISERDKSLPLMTEAEQPF